MNLSAFKGISQQASNVAAQQKVAQGVQDHGLGDGGGMLFGMNFAQAINPLTAAPAGPSAAAVRQAAGLSLDQQIETVKKLKDLVDVGSLSHDEFETKKKEVMGL